MDEIAFYGDDELKQSVIERLREHERHDAIVRTEGYAGVRRTNSHWEFRGCALGCTAVDFARFEDGELTDERFKRYEDSFDIDLPWNDHVARLLGLPRWLTAIEEAVFEGNYPPDTTWPRRLIEATPVGASFVELEEVRTLAKEGLVERLTDDGWRRHEAEERAHRIFDEGMWPTGLSATLTGETILEVLGALVTS